MTILHYIGVIAVLGVIAFVGTYSGRKVKNISDFSGSSGKAGSYIVAGTIMGTLMSGQATVGTAQLAFSYGLSAWWFTLGSGIGCLILGIKFSRPLRQEKAHTLLGVISREYGDRIGYMGSVLSSLGIFISVIAQVVSATALISMIFPIGMAFAGVISIAIMAVYVIFGGVWGAGMGGVVKTGLLYMVSVLGGLIALKLVSDYGLSGSLNHVLIDEKVGSLYTLNDIQTVSSRYFNLFARGIMKDIGSGLSLVLGVLSTQTYSQAIWAGNSYEASRKGALLSAILIPPIGIASIFIGMFMRTQCLTSAEISQLLALGQTIPNGMLEIANSAQVFPAFIINFMPTFIGGVTLGTLLITVVGGGAGLSLGVATVLVKDIVRKRIHTNEDPAWELPLIRACIGIVLMMSVLVMLLLSNTFINDLGYLSMGLRASVIFIPLCFALWQKGKVTAKYPVCAMFSGPLTVIVGNYFKWGISPLVVSIIVAWLIMAIGIQKQIKIFAQS